MLYAGLVVGVVICAIQAIRVARLLTASLWLACASALLAVLLYEIGGHEIAVVELSVGAGLVTVLFVFALSLIGDETAEQRPVIPKPLAGIASIGVLLLFGWLTLTGVQPESLSTASSFPSFSIMLWEERGLDVLVQVALIFAGVLAILGFLADTKSPITPARPTVARPGSADRALKPIQLPNEQELEEEYA